MVRGRVGRHSEVVSMPIRSTTVWLDDLIRLICIQVLATGSCLRLRPRVCSGLLLPTVPSSGFVSDITLTIRRCI